MPAVLENRVALITGGTSGIGRATAIAMAAVGAKVVLTGRRESEGQAVERAIADAGGEALFVKADVGRAEDADVMVRAAVDRFGRLDIAFNNAGVNGVAKPLADQTEEDFDAVMMPNIRGLWLSLRAEIRQMLKQGDGGSIINNGSIVGKRGVAMSSNYVVSKHAVEGYTKSVAIEVAPVGIRVNAVAPGFIKTPMTYYPEQPQAECYMIGMHAIPRMGEEWEVSSAVVFLASSAASFITGAILPVDGGCLAK
jgi:NAD(P)-dependent dehydrogenase (short-subunit alcohol dehydrogenase family)